MTQSQFAGYYAAKAKGYYKAAGLDVNLKVGGPTIVNEQTVLSKQAEFGVNWFPSLLANRDQDNNLVNIAQVFARSGTTEVTWKKDGINTSRRCGGRSSASGSSGTSSSSARRSSRTGWTPTRT